MVEVFTTEVKGGSRTGTRSPLRQESNRRRAPRTARLRTLKFIFADSIYYDMVISRSSVRKFASKAYSEGTKSLYQDDFCEAALSAGFENELENATVNKKRRRLKGKLTAQISSLDNILGLAKTDHIKKVGGSDVAEEVGELFGLLIFVNRNVRQENTVILPRDEDQVRELFHMIGEYLSDYESSFETDRSILTRTHTHFTNALDKRLDDESDKVYLEVATEALGEHTDNSLW